MRIERLRGEMVRPARSQVCRVEAASAAASDSPSVSARLVRGARMLAACSGTGRSRSRRSTGTTSSSRSPSRGAPPVRPDTKMRLATPVATATSTEISPSVSQARMSTSITLTMFLPCASMASAGSPSAIVGWMRAPSATIPMTPITMPASAPMMPRATLCTGGLRWAICLGRRRSTSTNTTSTMVSTSACVRARSGAPDMPNSSTSPYPVTLTSSTAVMRWRTVAAATAATPMTNARNGCAG